MRRYNKSQPPQVFISYSHKDRQFAENLANSLSSEGVSVWYDNWQIHVGDSIVRKIQQGLSSSDFLIILLSNNSTESKWVEQELNASTIRNIESEGIFILPALVEKCQIPIFLSDRKYADFTKDWTSAYEELLAAIDHHFDKQGISRKSILDNRLSIVHTSTTEEKGFPVIKFTITNRSGSSQVINRLEYDIVEYMPYASIPQTRLLKPIVVWDIELPYGDGSFDYSPSYPVLLANDDAVSISLRFHCTYEGKSISPKQTAGYKIRVRFMSDQGLIAASQIFNV